MPQNRLKRIVFSRKANANKHVTVYFNNVPVIRENIQKHLGLFLDSKLSFFDHINEKNWRGQCYKKNELVVATFLSADNI